MFYLSKLSGSYYHHNYILKEHSLLHFLPFLQQQYPFLLHLNPILWFRKNVVLRLSKLFLLIEIYRNQNLPEVWYALNHFLCLQMLCNFSSKNHPWVHLEIVQMLVYKSIMLKKQKMVSYYNF